MYEITGKTKVWAILADPIDHVQTPQGLNAIMRKRGVEGVIVPMHVVDENLKEVVSGLRRIQNFQGVIATVPHKTAMFDLCDEVSKHARGVGAVNAIRFSTDGRLFGEILDGVGFVAGLIEAGVDPAGKSVFLAGAGGAARAIAFALAEAGISRLTIANRTHAKSDALKSRLASFAPQLRIDSAGAGPEGHDLVVNATSLGLRGIDPLPLDVSRLQANQVVAEIIMQPETTPLLAEAEKRGCRTHQGYPMLKYQLELMADYLGMVPN